MAPKSRPSLENVLGTMDFGESNREPPKRSFRCCGLFGRSAPPPAFRQTLVVLRHSERRDYVDPTYKASEEGLQWPFDTPLTTGRGIELAQEVAEEMYQLHTKYNFAVIACSPYRRCLETAAEVAKRLNLRVVVDQEMGEVWDRNMPIDPRPYRSNVELKEMCDRLGMTLLNPLLEDGGLKLFGKPPAAPESLDDAKKRFVVRIQTYIEQSAETQQNFILVTHADAVAAALEMFERGFADIQTMEFCARLIARRDVRQSQIADTVSTGVYADSWEVNFRGVQAEVAKPEENAKYFERMHIDNCEETEKMATKRKEKRTKTDFMFTSAMKDLLQSGELDDEEDEQDEEEPDSPPAAAATAKARGSAV